MRRGTWIGIGGLAGVAAVFGARGETVTVPSSRCAIVAPAASNAIALAAGQELQKHLALLSGTNPPLFRAGAEEPGWFPFYVGVPVPDGATNWLPEEAGWRVSSNAVHLDGDLRGHGLRFAVYDFLETQAGIRWLMPGDAGIAYEPQPALTLTLGSFRGRPVLPQRHIRAYAQLAPVPRMADGASEEAIRQIEANNAVAQDVMDWQKRMRLGNRGAFNYGHAFTGWWDRYAKTHPDYFALNKHGKREPERPVAPTEANPVFTAKERANVKVCVSNPNVAEQIVDNWVAAGARGRWINTCETDLGWGFCRCPACTALDVPEPGESAANRSGQFEEHLTDRYVHLANAVMRAARKRGYDVGASLYAYNQSERPPRRLALETNAFVSIVPTTLDLDELEARFSGWARAGAPALHLRPNLTRYFQTVGLPLGIEKQFFDAFQIAYRHGAIGADYDRLMGQWALFGAADYILARAMGDPEKSFAYWMDHYCAAFGPAADDVKAYFRYWREEVWEKRLRPDLNAITERGK